MYNQQQYVSIIGQRQFFGTNLVTVSLVVIAICEFVFTTGHGFCGHSLASRRLKRADNSHLETQAQRGADSSAQVPQNQQEDQIVIDEPTSGEFRGEDNRTTGARVDCNKSVSGSRFDGQELGKRADGCSNTKTIETAVFIDQALDSKFNGMSGGLVDLNKLVLSIMNQVQYLFMYSSMKVPIKIKLVLVEHLKESERHGIPVPKAERGDIDAYLSNFCNWQYSRLQQNKRLWWDHAILLSGLVSGSICPITFRCIIQSYTQKTKTMINTS